MKSLLFIITALIISAVAVYGFLFFKRDPAPILPETQKGWGAQPLSAVAKYLEIPWSMVFLPDGSMLFTERPGRVRAIDKNGILLEKPIAQISTVKHIGEGGLLGITIHPDFKKNHFVYLYYTYSSDERGTENRVSRFIFENDSLLNEEIIINAIPGASFHNGGRIKFGPDNFLYITTGDSQTSSLSQNTNSLAGKILRVTDDGLPAPGNSFGNLVYSYGHRNPQGLAWDRNDQLWATEHGRSGLLSGYDELNKIEIGKNYGWPDIQGDDIKPGMERPILHSGAMKTWAPSGMAIVGESVFFTGLRGEILYEANISEDQISIKEHFKGEFGRLRDVILGPNGFLYIATSNRDGRGSPTPKDDRIIKVKAILSLFEN